MSTNIRSRLLKPVRRTKRITLNLPADDGALAPIEVELTAPTVADRNAIIGDVDSAGAKVVGSAKMSHMQVEAVIRCVRGLDGKPIFTPEDREELLALGSGSWFDEVFSEIMELMAGEEKQAKADFPPSAPNSP